MTFLNAVISLSVERGTPLEGFVLLSKSTTCILWLLFVETYYSNQFLAILEKVATHTKMSGAGLSAINVKEVTVYAIWHGLLIHTIVIRCVVNETKFK